MLPNVARALWNLTERIQFQTIATTPVQGEASEVLSPTPIQFLGMRRPIPPKELLMKPEGERDWQYWTVWTTQFLEMGSLITDCKGLSYKVMGRSDSSSAGYWKYEFREEPAFNS